MKKNIIFILVAVLILAGYPLGSRVFARVGVGVGIGKIEIAKPLKPGGVYDLTPLLVLNTGDESSDYEITVAYNSGQSELRPVSSWFSFDPQTFSLKPGGSQSVAVKLTLPVNAKPGNYFAYLQGQPKKKTTTASGATIGVAAATKLYFTVIPANIFQGMYYRFISLYSRFSPWDTVILVMLVVAALVILFKSYFNIQIGVKKK